jgi:MinD-like ATPase involved in chromosome partitioning or flagellar assembly
MHRTAAVVNAVGGAGATRLAVELGAALARDGRDVAVVDAALDTQGLARHLPDRIDPDLAAVLAGDADPAAARYAHPATGEVPGALVLAPVRAPFARVAAAKAPEAAERLIELLEKTATDFDHVLVDAPPVATNPAVAAVTAAERVALVAPPTERGADGVQRERGRLADVGSDLDRLLANRVPEGAAPGPIEADHVLPESAAADVPEPPACLVGETPFAPAVATAAADLFGVEVDADFGAGLLPF